MHEAQRPRNLFWRKNSDGGRILGSRLNKQHLYYELLLVKT
jgi:hypothetical protein